MSTNTSNMAMGKAVDGDNAKTYLETTLGAALDKLDAHDHSGTTKGLSQFAGPLGIGTAALAQAGLLIGGAITTINTQQFGLATEPIGSSAATTEISGIFTQPQTAAASFTCTSVVGVHAATIIKGASSTITSAYGALIEGQTVGGTNNYGLYVNAPSGGVGANIGAVINGGISVNGTPSGVVGNLGLTSTFAACGGGSTATLGLRGNANTPTGAGQVGWTTILVGTQTAFVPYWV